MQIFKSLLFRQLLLQKSMKQLLFIFAMSFSVYSCKGVKEIGKQFQAITAISYKNRIQTSENVKKFLKRSDLDHIPVVVIDPEFYRVGSDHLLPDSDGLYDREGKYIDIHSVAPAREIDISSSPPANIRLSKYNVYSCIANNECQVEGRDSTEVSVIKYDPEGNSSRHKIKIHADLNYFGAYFRDLDGNKIDINGLYADYLIIQEFNLGGKRKIFSLQMEEFLDEINSINQRSKRKIDILLLCYDTMDWMTTGQ